MKRKFTFLTATLALLAMLAVPIRGWGQTRDSYSYTFEAKVFTANNQTKTLNDVDWTFSGTANGNGYWGYDATKGQQFGSGNSAFSAMTLSTSGISGTISEIKVNTSGASSINATMNVTVGGNAFGNSISLTSSATEYTFSGSASGNISFNYTQTSSKAIYIKSIAVTYTTGGGSTTYTVTYDGNGATSGDVPVDDNEYENGDEVTVLGPGNLAKKGHTFEWWEDDNEDPYEEGDTFEISEDVTLTAQWSVNKYNVALASVENVDLSVAFDATIVLQEGANSNFNYGTQLNLIKNNIATGYIFGSWVITKQDDNSTVTNDVLNDYTLTMPDYAITISATLVQVYTVNFNLDGGTFVPNGDFSESIVEKPAGTYTLPAATKSGYSFNGWAVDATTYAAGDTYTVSGDVDFIAQWVESTELIATLNIESYADDNNWSNSTQYTTAIVNPVTFTANGASNTGKYYTNGEEWRYYQTEDASITISVPEGYHLVSIKPTYNQSNGGVLLNGSTTIQSGSTVDVSGTSVTFSVGNSGTATNGQVKFTNIDVTYEADGGTPAPSISANPIELSYETTSGTIFYSINNEPDPAGTISAEVTDGDWLTLGQNLEITFTCSVNPSATERTATVTLTYIYGDNQTATTDVTVTQLGNPNVFDNISDITQVAAYTVRGTVVATNSKGFIMGDGTGYVYYYKGSDTGKSVGDIVKVSGTTSDTYGQILQFTSAATVETATTSSYNNTPTATLITEVPDYSESLHLSTYFEFEGGLTQSDGNYLITLGETPIQISYPTTAQGNTLSALVGKTVHVKGYFSGINSSERFTVMMESVEEVPSITLETYSIEIPAASFSGFYDITYANINIQSAADFSVEFCDAVGDPIPAYPDWIITHQVITYQQGYRLEIATSANEGDERTTHLKVCASNVCSDVVTITQAAAPPVAHYNYSINGEEGQMLDAEVGTPVTLADGEDLNLSDNFTFAGWTLDPNDVENLYTEYTFQANETVTFFAVYAHTTGSAATRDGASYVKVTSTDDIEDGNYLIVAVGTYPSDETPYQVAFDGSLETLDVANNQISVSIENDAIASNTIVNASYFTITAKAGGYSVKSASGLFIGATAYENKLKTSENDEYTNLISFDEGNLVMSVAINQTQSVSLRFNSSANDKRFRYYKTGQQPIQLYKYTDGGTPTPQPTPAYYTRVFLNNETVSDDIEIVGPSIIPSGSTLDMGTYTLAYKTGVNIANLIIEDGGQLYTEETIEATIQKSISKYNITANNPDNNELSDGWHFISYPLNCDYKVGGDDPNGVTNMITNSTYDLYLYDPTAAQYGQTNQEEWVNYKPHTQAFKLVTGHGYLYANAENVILEFAGSVNYTDQENPGISLEEGYNLVGNPYAYNAYPSVSYYKMNEAGTAVEATECSTATAVPPCTGIIVDNANGTQSEITFSKNAPQPNGAINNGNIQMVLAQTVATRGGASTGSTTALDNAIVSFNEGSYLGKFYFGTQNANLYIPQGTEEYAIVSAEGQGEMPVNFHANENGQYTLSVNPENVEMNYLHLIDNMTGNDIDLLVEPSYTFQAKTTDYASRFRLVFSANNNTDENSNETFAYYNGNEWVISNTGEATLQLVDMTGRVIKSESINGCANMNVNAAAGVYMLRLVNGNDVKVQKVIVR